HQRPPPFVRLRPPPLGFHVRRMLHSRALFVFEHGIHAAKQILPPQAIGRDQDDVARLPRSRRTSKTDKNNGKESDAWPHHRMIYHPRRTGARCQVLGARFWAPADSWHLTPGTWVTLTARRRSA